MKHLLRHIAMFVLMVGPLACSSRVLSGTDADELRPASISGHGVTIRKVDGQDIGSNTSRIHVSPGKREVWVSANAANFSMLGEAKKLLGLRVNLEEGKSYAITSKRGSRRLCAYELEPGSAAPNFSRSAGCYEHNYEHSVEESAHRSLQDTPY